MTHLSTILSDRQPSRIVTFDLETRLDPRTVGWDHARHGAAGVSCLIAHDSLTDATLHYTEDTLRDFLNMVLEPIPTALCGYNILDFDIPVVEGLTGGRLNTRFVVDIYDYIKRALHRERRVHKRVWKLGTVAKRTMGLEKIGTGEFAPQLFAESRLEELKTYCEHDVTLTRALLDYVRRHGGVLDDSGDLLELDIPEWLRLTPKEAVV